jgi:SAM-dependent methyltransferase
MYDQAQHDMLVNGTQDEFNRQAYIGDLRRYLLSEVGAGMREVYDHRVKPAFERENGRAPATEHEVRRAMLKDPYAKTFSTMVRSCQEMIWDSVLPSVERQAPSLIAQARDNPRAVSTLELDPDLEVPRYLSAVDIHCMPGNYHKEWTDDDVAQGALFDRGLYIYQIGAAGPLCDSNGRTIAETIKRRWPDFKPKRILDLGCTIGNNTTPYTEVFPDAEVHAIDVAAPCLRYGQARAEALGKPVHFHQMNAEKTSFESGSFDLIVSCILFHETSQGAVGRILKECNRLLSPGGLMLHMEIPRSARMDAFEAFYMDWDTYYNNEPFFQAWSSLDIKAASVKAGFDPDNYVDILVPDFSAVPEEDFTLAVSEDKTNSGLRATRWGMEARWPLYGAWK